MEFLRKLFSKKDDMSFTEIRFKADEQAMVNAKRAGADTFKPPGNSLEIKLACLQRWYFLLKQQGSSDLHLEGVDLLQLEPSGLSENDMREWYWGLRMEAAQRYIFIMNSSYSKTEMHKRLSAEGLEDVEKLLDSGTRESCEGVIKYLSD